MRRGLRRGLLLGAMITASGLVAVLPAYADNLGESLGGEVDGGNLTARAVHLSGNGYAGTSGASGGETVTVYVPSPCWWHVSIVLTGDYVYENYYLNWDDDLGMPTGHATVLGDMVYPPKEELAAHRGEDGAWATKAMTRILGTDAAQECVDALTAANNGYDMVWVPAGEEPPAPPVPIPVEVLAEIAEENLTVPVPGVNVNPDARSYVNLPTWFWVEDGPSDADGFVTLEVTATAGDNSATVTAEPNRLALQSDGGPTATCTPGQAHTPWSVGASDDAGCTITHARSSAWMPGLAYTVTVTASYSASWSGVEDGTPVAGEDLGMVTSPPAASSVPVAEVQTLVTG